MSCNVCCRKGYQARDAGTDFLQARPIVSSKAWVELKSILSKAFKDDY